jgi:hypothetical protein
MSSDSNAEQPAEADVQEFAQKLERWGEQLPPKEQALLLLMLGRAHAAADADVRGFGLTSVGDATRELLDPLVGGGATQMRPSVWLEVGEPTIISRVP